MGFRDLVMLVEWLYQSRFVRFSFSGPSSLPSLRWTSLKLFLLWRSSEKFEFLSSPAFSSYSHPPARRRNNAMVAVDSKSMTLNGRKSARISSYSLFISRHAREFENINFRITGTVLHAYNQFTKDSVIKNILLHSLRVFAILLLREYRCTSTIQMILQKSQFLHNRTNYTIAQITRLMINIHELILLLLSVCNN